VNKKSLISVSVMFVMSMLVGLVAHGILLAPDYLALPTLFRSAEDQNGTFFFMLLAHVFIAIGFVWIYVHGKEDKPFLGQGIRYGLAVAVLVAVPTYLIYYAVQPMPGIVAFKQILFDTVGYVLMGIVVAALNK
jgi:glucose uptake protein GlcU